MKKFGGLILLAAILNQQTLLFERSMTKAYQVYFSLGGGQYEPEQVRNWYFSIQFLTSLFSLWIVTKIQPTFFYGISAIVLGIVQFMLGFFQEDSLDGYVAYIGIFGGISSGCVILLPIYILWRTFDAKAKGIVLCSYFVCMGFLQIPIDFALRVSWFGQSNLPTGEDVKK